MAFIHLNGITLIFNSKWNKLSAHWQY